MSLARPYTNPYLAGVGIGVVLLGSFLLVGRGLGAFLLLGGALREIDSVLLAHAESPAPIAAV